jgi:hypothetical protein
MRKKNIAQVEQPKKKQTKEDILCFDYQPISITENQIFTVCKREKEGSTFIYMR